MRKAVGQKFPAAQGYRCERSFRFALLRLSWQDRMCSPYEGRESWSKSADTVQIGLDSMGRITVAIPKAVLPMRATGPYRRIESRKEGTRELQCQRRGGRGFLLEVNSLNADIGLRTIVLYDTWSAWVVGGGDRLDSRVDEDEEEGEHRRRQGLRFCSRRRLPLARACSSSMAL
jgi:hypothetical protein